MKSTKKLNTEKFIIRAKKIHKDFYVYDKTIYKDGRTKVVITCPKHGDFILRPDLHLMNKPRGCQMCGNGMITQEEFINSANKIHKNKYSYSFVFYKNKKEKIIITCPKHGNFKQSPQKHLSGQGCPFCGRSEFCGSNKMTTELFIKAANKKHKNRYIYTSSKFIKSHEKLKVICKKHGVFEISPTSHLSGCGCNKCGFNTSLAGDKWIESFKNPNIIPEKTIKINGKRFKIDGIDFTTKTIYEYFGSFWHGNPERKDLIGLHPILKVPYSELYKKTIDRIRYMEENGFKVVYQWGH